MSGSLITVPLGPPTQLSGASFPTGSTIKNMDSVNAVWIASTNTVKPGLGFKLNALATMEWPANNGLPFAIPDTGVVTPVVLNVTNDATNTSDPLSIAIATATALLAGGIPNVLVTKVLFSGVVAALGTVNVIDVTGYASLTVIAFATVNGQPLNLSLSLAIDAVQDGFSSIYTSSIPPPFGGGAAAIGGIQIPVTKGFFSLGLGSLTGATVYIIGSNRPCGVPNMLESPSMPRRLIASQAAGLANQITTMKNQSDGQLDSTVNNGTLTISGFSNLSGSLFYYYYDVLGTQRFVFVGAINTAVNTTGSFSCAAPLARVGWAFQQIPAGALDAEFTISSTL